MCIELLYHSDLPHKDEEVIEEVSCSSVENALEELGAKLEYIKYTLRLTVR